MELHQSECGTSDTAYSLCLFTKEAQRGEKLRGPGFAVEMCMRMIRSSVLVVLALTAALAGLASCGALSPMAAQPQVTVRSVSLSAAGFSGVDGTVAMDIYNPNGFALPLRRVDWTLSVGSVQAVRGSFDLTATIPAKASAPVDGRLHIDVGSAVGVASALAQGVRSYEISATLTFQTRFGDLRADVQHQGQLL